ncbi:centrin-3 isoform X3 [Paramormyrops kingsleyae]|nr:centrin-3 isoform X3 [Paramormyrops kingsleyae]
MRALGFDVKKSDVLKILKDYDREGSGKITFDDFNEVVAEKMLERDPQEEILKAFKLFDDDDSGKISLRNLRRVARELGENISDEELRAMIDEFDTDGDGESTGTRKPGGVYFHNDWRFIRLRRLLHHGLCVTTGSLFCCLSDNTPGPLQLSRMDNSPLHFTREPWPGL